jgi:hypothetical protein
MSLQHEKDRESGGDRHMTTTKLQTILGYLNIGLAVAHDAGVTLGHFGSTDFISLAESVNELVLNSIAPAAASVSPVSVAAAS